MAMHINSVDSSGIVAVSKAQFYSLMRPGDMLYCSGDADVSNVIKWETKSPWSHVLAIWSPGSWGKFWLTLEATISKGVHVGVLSDYIDGYQGELVLARRPKLTTIEIQAQFNAGLALLDDGYDWEQEVSIAARKLLKALPLIKPKGDLYCSGLMYMMSLVTPYPLKKPLANFPTPEDNWTDPSVVPVAILSRGPQKIVSIKRSVN